MAGQKRPEPIPDPEDKREWLYPWIKGFLLLISEFPNIVAACRKLNISRTRVYNLRKSDPEFEEAFIEAWDMGVEALEGEAMRRAMYGTTRPVYQGGQKVGAVREYSDAMIIFMLKKNNPGKYGDKLPETTIGTVPIRIVEVTRPDDHS